MSSRPRMLHASPRTTELYADPVLITIANLPNPALHASPGMVLVRRAGSIRRPEQLAGWLHGVAYRVATRVRARIARQRARERQEPLLEEKLARPEAATPDDWYRLHQELSRLPDKFRLPLLLCYFEGMAREQAARQLGWSEGALKGKTRARAFRVATPSRSSWLAVQDRSQSLVRTRPRGRHPRRFQALYCPRRLPRQCGLPAPLHQRSTAFPPMFCP
jgi:hypothetical protein